MNFATVFFYLTILALAVAAVIDFKNQEVDWKILCFAVLAGIIYAAFKGHYLNSFYCLLTFVTIPLLLVLISREAWMGWGDVLFALAAGLIANYPESLIGVSLAFWLGSIFGIIYLATKPIKKTIPFGPFLILGSVLAVFFGKSILVALLNSSIF